jgi:hypothetical protein
MIPILVPRESFGFCVVVGMLANASLELLVFEEEL